MTERPRWVQFAEQRDAAAKGGRSTAWERAMDDGDGDIVHGANADCFSCFDLGIADSCRAIARAALAKHTKKNLNIILDCFEYRQKTDPHEVCPHHVLADETELARRMRRMR